MAQALEIAKVRETRSVGAQADAGLSDPQEYDFLPRREGRAWSADLVDARVRDIRAHLAEVEAHDGEAKHKLGSMLRELYSGYAERVKGRSSFADFAQSEFEFSRPQIYNLLRLAASASQSQARLFGITRCLLGIRLLKLTGLQSFDALSKRPLALAAGTQIFFSPQTPTRQLEESVRVLLEKEEAGEITPAKRRAANEVQRLNRELARMVEDDPVLEKVPVRYVSGREGEPMLKVPLLDREQRKAFLRLLPKLLRAES